MTTKTKIISVSLIIATSFAIGRYSVQQPAVKTVEIVNSDTETQKNTHKETTITKDKNGNEVTKITEDTTSKKSKETTTKIDQTITPSKKGVLNVSGLIGTDGFSLTSVTPVYGISVSKEFIGPITVGLFGLTNHTIGVSLGVNF